MNNWFHQNSIKRGFSNLFKFTFSRDFSISYKRHHLFVLLWASLYLYKVINVAFMNVFFFYSYRQKFKETFSLLLLNTFFLLHYELKFFFGLFPPSYFFFYFIAVVKFCNIDLFVSPCRDVNKSSILFLYFQTTFILFNFKW